MTATWQGEGVLLEREDVLAAIAADAEDARGGRGRVVLVEGAPGAGKTAVLRAATSALAAMGPAVSAARGGELEQQLPWGIARTVLRPLATAAPDAVGPVAGAVLGLGGGHAGDDVAALFELTELCLAAAAERPLALVIDDAHWADEGSARFLAHLAARVAAVPVLLLIAARPDDPRRPDALVALGALDGVRAVSLEPLSAGGTAALLADALPGVAPDVVDACHAATGGNLFLLSELVREIASGTAPPTPDAVAGLEIASVDRAAARRLAAAGEDAASLAEAAAVLGDDAQLADAAALAGLGYAQAARAADDLRAAGVLAADGAGLAFAHPLLLAAVRRRVPPGQRSLLHHAAARRLDAAGAPIDRVGAHLLASEPGDDAWARERLAVAADAALAAGAPAAAVALLQRAVAERAPGGEAELLVRLGRAALPVDPALAEGPLRRALRLIAEPESRVAPALALSTVLQMLRRPAEATTMLLALDGELAAAGAPRRVRLRVQAEALAQSFFDRRTRELRDRLLPELTDELDGRCDEELLLLVHRAVDRLNHGTADEVRAIAARAWGGGRLEAVAGAPETPTVMWLPYLHLYVDEPAWTAALMEEWVTRAREQGSAVLASFGHALLAQAQHRTGALREAEATARAGWEVAQQFGPAFPGWWIALGTSIDCLLARGAVDDAHALADGVALLDGPPSDTMLMPAPRVVRAQLLHAAGELDRAVAELRAAWEWIAEEDVVSPGAWWFPAQLVEALLVAGERKEAAAVADAWLARTAAFGAASTLGQAQRVAALAGPRDDLVAGLEQAVATLAASPARAEEARALTDLGAALRRDRRRSDAREPLRRALDIATRCGAAGVAERAREELLAAGGRPRRDVLEGPDALTPAERRVAALAGQGLTNREIANTLFVSHKTVERHLGNLYLKLGHNDRTRLASGLEG